MILGQTSPWHNVVDMEMVAHIASPGVQSTDHTDLTAHEPGIESEFLQSLGRSLEQKVIDELLVGACYTSEL